METWMFRNEERATEMKVTVLYTHMYTRAHRCMDTHSLCTPGKRLHGYPILFFRRKGSMETQKVIEAIGKVICGVSEMNIVYVKQ